MSTSSVLSNIRSTQSFIDTSLKGTIRQNGESIIDVQVVNQGNGIHKLVSTRREDSAKLSMLNKSFARAEQAGALFAVNSKITEALGNPKDSNFIANTLTNFLNDFRVAQGADASSERTNIISSAQNFTSAATNYVEKLRGIKNTLEMDVSAVVTSINNNINKISSINSQLGNYANNFDLLDARDNAVSTLSQYIDINYSFASSGKVTIRTQGGNVLVSDNTHSQILYTQDMDLLSHNNASDVMKIMEYSNGRSTSSDIQIVDVMRNFGGTLSGLLKARVELLPTALASINNTIFEIADKIDNLHNRGSGFPPAPSLTSGKSMRLTDSAIFKGKVNFAITDDTGNSVKDVNGNYVKPVTVDFDKLSSRNSVVAGQFTTQDIMNEINQVAAGYGKASVGLGSIATPVGTPPQWLIDQVRLVPTSDIAADGTIAFQLELNSGSGVNTTFQVTDRIIFNQANNILVQPAGFAPQAAVNIEAGQNTKTGQNIIIRLNPGENHNIVRLKICVIGANGVVEESWADFNIGDGVNPLGNAQIMNQRAEAVPSNNAIGGGLAATISAPAGIGAAATLTNAKCAGQIVIADFVDSNGLSINNVSQVGYLKVSAAGGGLIIDQATSAVLPTNATNTNIVQTFGRNYGLNNFFTADSVNPAANIAVRADIISNPGLIALGKTIHNQMEQNVMVGQTLPSAVLDIIAQPAVGDNIIINGMRFNFARVAVLATDIVIGANVVATTQNIYNALHAQMRGTVTATQPNGGTNLIITAVQQNANIGVLSSNAVATQWKMPPATVGGIPGSQITQLVTGSASAILDCSGGAANPIAADTVTVNGVIFTFAAIPVAANDVQVVAGNAVASIANLQAALTASTDPRIAGLFVFTIDPVSPDQLIVTARNAGFEGNKLQIDSIIAGGGNAWKEPGGGLFNIINLEGGFSTAAVRTIDTYAPKIGVNSNTNMQNLNTELFTFVKGNNIYTQTIPDFMSTGFLSDTSSTYHENKMSSDIADKVSKTLHAGYNDLVKMTDTNRDMLYGQALEMMNLQKVNYGVWAEMRDLFRYILGVLN